MAKITIDLDTLPDDVAAYLVARAGVTGSMAEIRRQAIDAIIEGLRLLDAQEAAERDASPLSCDAPPLDPEWRASDFPL